MTKILLDSHTLLWALYSPEILPKKVSSLLQASDTVVFVSEGSLWELADKAAKNRLPLAGNSVTQLTRDIETLNATLLSIEREDILPSVVLPPVHGDPFDRLFVAQARSRGLALVSKDPDIANYDVQVIWN